MKVGQYLCETQNRPILCRPEDTVQSVADLLTSHHIGALPVRDSDGRLVGVISERDLVRALSSNPAGVQGCKVIDLMTANPVTCTPETRMDEAMTTMAGRGFRHMPVVDGEAIVGMISMRDSLSVQLGERELEASVLRDNVIAARYN